MSILATGKLRPIQGQAAANQFGREVASVRQEAFCDQTIIRKLWLKHGGYRLALTQLDQGPFRLLSPGVIEFWRIDAGESNARLSNHDGIPVNHPATPLNGGRCLGLTSWFG